MQKGIQRSRVIRKPIKPDDLSISPEKDCSPKTDKVVPDSFEEWLAHPTQTISAGPEAEQGIFKGLMNESSAQTVDNRRKRPRKRRIAS